MSFVSGMIIGTSSAQNYGNVSYSIVTPTKQMMTPTKQFGMNPRNGGTPSETGSWQVISCPSSGSKQPRVGLNDYEISSVDMITKKTAEIRYFNNIPAFSIPLASDHCYMMQRFSREMGVARIFSSRAAD
jgi:hypothetical protein